MNNFLDNQASYQYKGLPLTPAIAQSLNIELLSGKCIRRNEIIELITTTHEERGGIKSAATDVSALIKKSLQNLTALGIASNPSYSYWRFQITEDEASVSEPEPAALETPYIAPPIIGAEKTIGKGSGGVYVYYLPAYQALAKSAGHDHWLCKVGRSDRDPVLRIISQAGTALPERPVIALLVRTDDPSSLESAIHGILRLRLRWSPSSPGTEWFLTNPSEVEQIVEFIGLASE